MTADTEAGDPRRKDVRPYSTRSATPHHCFMFTVSVEMLVSIALLILVAVAAGTLTGRFFVAASRTDARATDEEI